MENHHRVSCTAPVSASCVEPTRFTRARHLSRSCARGSVAAGPRPSWLRSRLTTSNQRVREAPRGRFQPNEPRSKSRIAREEWSGGKRSTCPYQRTRRRAAKEESGACPARAHTVSLETRSRQWMPRIDLRALLSKPSSLKERVPVRGQVSAPYSSTDRTAALYMRILEVREMDFRRHNGLRSACITFDDSARLRSISGLRSTLLVTVETRYTNESANSTAFPSMFRDGESGPSPTCISLVFL